ncbi:ATP-binding protein [Leptothermofonsia sp. ETS-13]|uniref:hybrid sensor histidine kinase/response regulator n=1 Tax=Leptothermofonsia sp. ETS-13 TaxID=3035696 RepID=UPI003B9E63A9
MARILIVEDNQVVAWHIQETLENLDHKVVAISAYGAEAIEIAEKEQPELVLMDICLKGSMDGVTAAEEIYRRFDIPIIYLTAYTDPTTVQRAKLSCPFGYLVKPLREQDLQTTVEIALYRHEQERGWRANEKLLATTLSSLGDGAIVTDLSGTITFINPIAEALTGWQQQEAIGQPVTNVVNLIHQETRERLENPLLKAMQLGSRIRLVERSLLLMRDGTERPVGDSAAPIRTSEGEVIGGVMLFQEVSDRTPTPTETEKEESAQEQTQERDSLAPIQSQTQFVYDETRLRQEMELLNRLKEDFVNSISHELRTPLTNMRMAVEMLRRIVSVLKKAEDDSKTEQDNQFLWQRMEQYLQILYEEWRQEFNLITDLLDLQTVESSTEALSLVSLELQQWLPEIVNRFTSQATEQGQTLTCQIALNLPPITTRPASLERLITELLSNALKYTPSGEVITVEVGIVEIDGEGGRSQIQDSVPLSPYLSTLSRLQITVTNTGVTIPPEEKERIFQPFYRIDRPNPWNLTGTGLGLALVKKLALQLGGDVWVESGNESTCFGVTLPI